MTITAIWHIGDLVQHSLYASCDAIQIYSSPTWFRCGIRSLTLSNRGASFDASRWGAFGATIMRSSGESHLQPGEAHFAEGIPKSSKFFPTTKS